MEIRTKLNNKGFTLFEALIAALILTIVGSGIAGVYVMEGSLLVRTGHRLEAINYARSVADQLINIGRDVEISPFYGYGDVPAELSSGLHTETTDPTICILPDSYFKLHLNGKLTYTVDQIDFGNNVKGRRVEIIIEWNESFPKKQKIQETLFIIAYFYTSYY